MYLVLKEHPVVTYLNQTLKAARLGIKYSRAKMMNLRKIIQVQWLCNIFKCKNCFKYVCEICEKKESLVLRKKQCYRLIRTFKRIINIQCQPIRIYL